MKRHNLHWTILSLLFFLFLLLLFLLFYSLQCNRKPCQEIMMMMMIILHLYSAFSIWKYSNALYNTLWGTLPDCFKYSTVHNPFNVTSRIQVPPEQNEWCQTTTPGTSCPALDFKAKDLIGHLWVSLIIHQSGCLVCYKNFGFIKRVDKGWITTMKDLENFVCYLFLHRISSFLHCLNCLLYTSPSPRDA